MKVVLIRHLKVVVRRRYFLTGKQFDEGMVLYDAGDIAGTEFKISPGDFPVCYTSTMKRAVETAKLIYAGKFVSTDDLVEVKNASSFMRIVSIPGLIRSLAGRIAWYMNAAHMPETRRQSNARAKKFIDALLAHTQADTLVVTHGFFMHCLKDEIKKNGFKGKLPLFPKNGHPYVFERGE
jgi:broad specificity phosphatase PhoE